MIIKKSFASFINKKCWQVLVGVVILAVPLQFSLEARMTIYDTPSALSMSRGEFFVDGHFFGNGSVLFKAGAGVNEYINLGVIEYVYDFIGSGPVRFQIPHVFGKFKLTPFGEEAVNFAIGYDSLYNGSFNPFDKPSYGFYAVTTVGFPKDPFLASPHFFSFGLRLPVYHQFAEPDIFASLHLRFNRIFEIASEIHNVHFSKQYKYYFVNNTLLIFNISDEFSLDIMIEVAGRIDENARNGVGVEWGRALRLRYRSFF